MAAPLIVSVIDASRNPVTGAGAQLRATSTSPSDFIAGPTESSGNPGQYLFAVTLGADATARTIKVCLTVAPEQCATFQISTTQQTQAAAKQVITPQATAAVTTATQQLSNIQRRLDNVRMSRNPTVTQGLSVNVDGRALPLLTTLGLVPTDQDGKIILQKGGGASADSNAVERWGVFVQGDLDIGKLDSTVGQRGFDIRTKGVTVGSDYRFPANHVLGAALGLTKVSTDLADNAGDQDTKGWSFSVYGEYVPVENGYVDLALNYGRNKYDTTRRVTDPTQSVTTFEYTSSPRGNQVGAALSAGYQFYHGSWTLTPYGRVEYVDASIDAFQENGGAGALQISRQRYRNTVLSAGGQAQYAWSTAWGVLVPYLRAELQYGAQAKADQVTAEVIGISSSGQPLALPGTDRTYGNLAAGASVVMPRGLSGFFNYEYLIGKENFSQSRYTLSLRYEF